MGMNDSRPPPRLLLVLLVATCLTTVTALVAGLVAGRDADRDAARDADAARALVPVARAERPASGIEDRPALRAAAVLRAWDDRRARAWARGDLVALRGLYTPGAQAGRRDAAMLRAWRRRGLTVHGMRTQVLDLHVVSRGRGRLVLVVTDRLAHAVAVGGARAVPLPRDRATARTIVLDRRGRTWRVASVRDRAQPAR
jgi:hypothetical protein